LHIDRATEEANKLSLPTYAALVAAVILGSQNANITEAAILATMAANIQSNLNFTRAHEREADHIGMKILTQSQFDPHAMPAFFERLQQNDRLYDAQVPEFFRTHPVTSNRIAETRDRASKYDYHPLPDKLRFHLIKAKIRVLSSDNPADMVARYEAKLNTGSYTHRYAELYGYSLALLKNHQFEEAGKVIESLIKEDRERIPYLLVKAQIKSSSGQVKESYSVFEDALALYPNNYALSHSYAETLLQFGEPEKAASLLNSMKKNHPTPPLYQLLAKAEGESRHTAKAHQALAEFYFLNGLTHTAIEQLNLALKQRRVSDMDKIRIESRMQEFKEIALAEKNLDLN
ncbi:MAG: tetratricopeptide repeat protein, partial [Gammaproteobacteria bacterium]|nr:tetratricopeptide repeat protein [Gammaproteobacteria bacterium]